MRTTLKHLKNRLFSDILNSNFKYFFYRGEMSYKAFLIAFLPSQFINSDDNASIINTNTNKSSRLSNIFNRATEIKKLETKFRERFILSFDTSSFNEMIENAKFFLRGYNPEQYELLVQDILTHDDELNQDQYLPIFEKIQDTSEIQPEVSLAVMILWAFHIGSFDQIIEIITTFDTNQHSYSNMKGLSDLLKKRNVSPNHAIEYLNIATTYGINGGLAAIALNAHIENTSDINPLIYNEVANLYYYGFSVPKQDRVYAKQLYELSAEQDFGPALWTIGILGDNAKYNLEKLHYAKTHEYYHRSIKNDNYLSYNNIGKAYHRTMVYYLNNKNYNRIYDFFSIEDKNNIIEIYNVISQEKMFSRIIKKYHLNNDLEPLENFDNQVAYLKNIYDAELYLIKIFFQPSYESGYFYAKGSELMIYENQLERYISFYKEFGKDFTETSLHNEIINNINHSTIAFAEYPCSESYYKYGLMIEAKGHAFYQSAYDYYYNAVFKVPLSGYRIHATIDLLMLHKNPYVQFKKNLASIKDLLLNVFNNYQSDTLHTNTRMFNLIELYKKDFETMILSEETSEKLRSNLIIEMNSDTRRKTSYLDYLSSLQ